MAESNRDEATRGVPEQRSAAGVPGSPPRPRRGVPWRRVLLLAVLGAGLAAIGAVGYGFVLYDQATRPDRSAPDVVVDNYLRALLVERDDVRAGLFACRDESRLTEIRSLRDSMLATEQRFAISIRVTWGSLAVDSAGDRATVTTELVRTISDGSEQSRQPWRFDLVDQDGWRVCGAGKAG